MITGNHIHEALTHLPEELLAPVDALRRKKRIPWKPLAVSAACLCLCFGLWVLMPDTTAENSAGSAEVIFDQQSSTHTSSREVLVYEVHPDHLLVIPDVPETGTLDVQHALIKVTFENLDRIPAMQQQQRIRVYYAEDSSQPSHISPYCIEIMED